MEVGFGLVHPVGRVVRLLVGSGCMRVQRVVVLVVGGGGGGFLCVGLKRKCVGRDSLCMVVCGGLVYGCM